MSYKIESIVVADSGSGKHIASISFTLSDGTEVPAMMYSVDAVNSDANIAAIESYYETQNSEMKAQQSQLIG